MDRYAKLNAALKGVMKSDKLPILAAEVTNVNADTCDVKIGALAITDVRLKSTIGGSDKLLILPKKGSKVLVGSLTGDFKDLVVLKVDEMEKLKYEQDGLMIEVDATTGKLMIKNNNISFVDLWQQLVDLLKQFGVTTPSGPSTAVLPPTMQSIVQLENDFKQILN